MLRGQGSGNCFAGGEGSLFAGGEGRKENGGSNNVLVRIAKTLGFATDCILRISDMSDTSSIARG